MVTAAKCGALQLCRITVWDQALGVTTPGGGGDAGGGRDVPILPQNMGLGGESQPARPNAGHPGENPLMFLGSNVSGG